VQARTVTGTITNLQTGKTAVVRRTLYVVNQAVYNAPAPPVPDLVNISTRAYVKTGDEIVIAGFVVRCMGTKQVVIRGIGQGLRPGIATDLDARITVYGAAGQVVGANDNWRDGTPDALQSAGLAPSNDLDAALYLELEEGPYTVHLSPSGLGATGIGIVEVYDLGGDGPRMINISTRAYVQTGDNIVIAGFVVNGNGTKKVAIRGIGQGLKPGIPTNLDARITLFNGAGQQVAQNDNWGSGTPAELQAAGLAPSHSLDAGLVLGLPPGAYTVHMSPAGANGIGMVEVYDLD
jgi:hypothetical protein